MRKKNTGKLATMTPTVIAEGTHVLGDLKFYGTLVVEGEITGNIISQEGGEPSVTVLDKGLVRGEVRAPSVVVSGRVKGDIYADKLVELANGAVVEGNVYYTVLEVAKGAQVNGSLVQGKPNQKLAKSAASHAGQVNTQSGVRNDAMINSKSTKPA